MSKISKAKILIFVIISQHLIRGCSCNSKEYIKTVCTPSSSTCERGNAVRLSTCRVAGRPCVQETFLTLTSAPHRQIEQ